MTTPRAMVTASAPPGALDLLKAAVAELDSVVAEGLARDAADRLNGAAALVEESMAEIERGGR